MKAVHNTHNVTEHDGVCIYPQLCTTCIEFTKQETAAKITRSEYEKNKERIQACTPRATYVSVDMQKVLMLPHMPGYKIAIFTKHMVCFHETFAPIALFVDHRPLGVVWNESITGRNACDVASSFVQYIRGGISSKGMQEFYIWTDNCSAQNKNWTLYTALTAEINKENGPRLVTIKYFEPGHTLMSADSFHRIVEQRLKQKNSDFIEYLKGVSSGKYASFKPKLENVKVVQFRKGSKFIFWKESLVDNCFQSAAFLLKKL